MIKKLLTTGFEREQLHNDQSYECLQCNEAIFNPLCHNCLAEQLKVWLSSYPDLNKRVMPYLEKYLRDLNNQSGDSTLCISCNNSEASICPYCFTEYILHLLQKLQINRMIIGEFLIFFNYDFDKTGYSRQAEEEGLL